MTSRQMRRPLPERPHPYTRHSIDLPALTANRVGRLVLVMPDLALDMAQAHRVHPPYPPPAWDLALAALCFARWPVRLPVRRLETMQLIRSHRLPLRMAHPQHPRRG